MDPGPHGTGRYSEHMLPEVEKRDFRKGSQVIQYFPEGLELLRKIHSSGNSFKSSA